MKKVFTYIAALFLALSFASCDKIFDSLEGDLEKMSEDDLTSSEAGLMRLLSVAYQKIPMGAFSTNDQNTLDATSTHGASYGISITGFWSYSNMRAVNKLFNQIQQAYEKGAISETLRDNMLGEAHFIRAYYYFGMVRAYGGVPIVEEPLDDKYDGGEDISGLLFPRKTEKETWDYVLAEFEKAADLLPDTFGAGNYRANKYAAYALEGRAALYAASVSKYWGKAPIDSKYTAVREKLAYMESSYADQYYKKCIEACEKVINSGKYSLHGGTAPASVDAAKKALQELFTARQEEEFIFGRSYELGQATSTNGFDYGNSPHQVHANGSGWQWGRYSVTLNIVDAFDDYNSSMGRTDGTVKTRNDGVEDHYVTNLGIQGESGFDLNADYIKYNDPSEAFAKKDARFQAHVVYPGCTFRNTKIIIQGGIIKPDGKYTVYNDDKAELNGKTYYTFGGQFESDYSGFHLMDNDNAGNWYNSGFGIAKFLDPGQALLYSTNPWPDIRYAEVLLNYAEAVVESGQGDKGLAKKVLNDIRHRAAFKDDIELTIENVLHERRVELAFEYDLPYTLHRRRAYVFGSSNAERKRSLVPMIDLRGSEAKYILVRANVYNGDVAMNPNGLYIGDYRAYYSGISNADKNQIAKNPSQE